MRIYCSMQFLESPRTSDQSDLKVERQQEAPAARSRSGKVKAADGTHWTCYVFATWKGVILAGYWIHIGRIVSWWRPHSRSHHRSHHGDQIKGQNKSMRLFHHVGPYRTLIHSRDNWQMTAARKQKGKSTNYWKSGPDDLVTSISPISEGTYLSQTDRRYRNRPKDD